MKATYHQHILKFKRPSGTSRGVLKTKETWFLIIQDGERKGIGECGLLRSLSIDDRPDYEEKLQWVCENIALGPEMLWNLLMEFPSIQFGVEIAFQSLRSLQPFELFPSAFTNGEEAIPINGLVWMGEKQFMKEQIVSKIKEGFRCIKLKIGAIDFQEELDLLSYIRSEFSRTDIELRVDANGAFSAKAAIKKLQQLAQFDLHSIEQPIKPNQWEEMARLCDETPLPIALDEELIGVTNLERKRLVLDTIKPQYVIFKPSLIGGLKGTQEWIDACETHEIDWWITSALESNVGLNAISQWTFTKDVTIPQGLGTGSLYTNNISSPLEVKEGYIHYNPVKDWNFNI